MRHWVLVVGMSGLTSLSACRGEPFRSCPDSSPGCAEHSETVDAANGDDTVPSSVTLSNAPISAPGNGQSAVHVEAGTPPAPGDDSSPLTPAEGPSSPLSDAAVSPAPASAEPSSPQDVSSASTSAASSAAATTAQSDYMFGESLITNGDFSDGNTHWDVERSDGFGNLSVDTEDQTLCLSARGQVNAILGWPDEPSRSLVLPGGRYRFSFRVRGSGVRLWAKVGHAHEPYTVLFEAEWYSEQTGWHEVAHEFTFDGDDAAGIAFTIELNNGSNVCFDAVALQPAVPASDASE